MDDEIAKLRAELAAEKQAREALEKRLAQQEQDDTTISPANIDAENNDRAQLL